jgi:hypothetical protein
MHGIYCLIQGLSQVVADAMVVDVGAAHTPVVKSRAAFLRRPTVALPAPVEIQVVTSDPESEEPMVRLLQV